MNLQGRHLLRLADFSPDVVNKLAISCNGSNACVMLDGSLSHDAESPNSALTFTWYIEPSGAA